MDDANKELWRVGCEVADMGRNKGMVVLHSRTVLAVQAEIERLRAALADEQADKALWVRRADKTWHEAHAVAAERERCVKIVETANMPAPGLPMVNTTEAQLLAYKIGHRDARHAAAELANEHDALLGDFRLEVQRCFDLAQRMDVLEPGVPGAFTGTPSERIARQLAVMRDEFVSG